MYSGKSTIYKHTYIHPYTPCQYVPQCFTKFPTYNKHP